MEKEKQETKGQSTNKDLGERKKELKKPKEKKSSDRQEIAELTDSLQRLQAEFENYKKYVEKEKQEFMKFAKAQLIGTLLPVIDAFEMALQQTKSHEKFVEGMNIIFDQFRLTLENEGLRKIEALDKHFDSHLHEIMMKKPSEKEEGVVIGELQKGYLLHDKVLRHSKVIVSEGKKNESQETENTPTADDLAR